MAGNLEDDVDVLMKAWHETQNMIPGIQRGCGVSGMNCGH
jgi:hypothetical protein